MTAENTLNFPRPLESVQVTGAVGGGGRACETAASGPNGPKTLEQLQGALEAERNQLRAALAALQAGAAKLDELRRQVLQQAEEQLLGLATGIARKVLMQEIQADRYEIEPIVKEALCHVSARQDVVIRLNPADYAQCEMARQEDESGGAGHVRFVADPGVRRAQCLVETSEGLIESSVEAHLEDITEVLKSQE